MLKRLTATILAGLPTLLPVLAWGADTSGGNEFPPPAAAAPASSQPFSADTPIETLAADPGAAAIVECNFPGLLENPHYPAFKSMSLKTVAAMSGGRISAGTLSAVDAQLKAMPVTAAAR